MKFLKILIKSELAGLLALLVFSLLVGIGAFIGSHMPVQYSGVTSFKSIDAAFVLALGLTVLGFSAALIGVIPGILTSFFNAHMGILVASCGLVVASIAHGFSSLVKPELYDFHILLCITTWFLV